MEVEQSLHSRELILYLKAGIISIKAIRRIAHACRFSARRIRGQGTGGERRLRKSKRERPAGWRGEIRWIAAVCHC